MSLGLYVLGILVSAIGVMMVGFGIPINEFSLGNTLIIAGTSAIAGGVVVIGLAAAVRQLNRIADVLTRSGGRPVVARPPEPAEPQPVVANGKPAPAPAPGRVPFPPRVQRPDSATDPSRSRSARSRSARARWRAPHRPSDAPAPGRR